MGDIGEGRHSSEHLYKTPDPGDRSDVRITDQEILLGECEHGRSECVDVRTGVVGIDEVACFAEPAKLPASHKALMELELDLDSYKRSDDDIVYKEFRNDPEGVGMDVLVVCGQLLCDDRIACEVIVQRIGIIYRPFLHVSTFPVNSISEHLTHADHAFRLTFGIRRSEVTLRILLSDILMLEEEIDLTGQIAVIVALEK